MAAAMATDDLAAAREQRRRSSNRPWRLLVAAGSVAAAVAVVIGVSTMHGAESSKSSANAAQAITGTTGTKPESAATAANPPGTVDFGDVTQPGDLRAQGLQTLAGPSAGASSPEATRKTAYDGGLVGADRAAPAPTPATFAANALGSCIDAMRRRDGIPTQPAIVGTGTVSGEPVMILIFDNGAVPVAYVVRPRACTLVRRQPLS